MVVLLVAGVLVAVCHDQVYRHFNGQQVSSTFQQQMITNLGTALAFLVKMFFALATGAAFSQQLFYSLRQKPETIGNLDRLFDLLENALFLCRPRLWIRHPVLLVIALITWCLPLTALFTPGTIRVQPSIEFLPPSSMKPPQPQQSWVGTQKFAACQLDYTAMHRLTEDGPTYVNAICTGPSSDLYSVAVSSVSQKSVLAIPPPSQNSSYSISFAAPALACTAKSESDASAVNSLVNDAKNASYLPGMHTILGGVNSPDGLAMKYNGWRNAVSGFQTSGGFYNLSNPDWHNATAAEDESPSTAYDNGRGEKNENYFFFASDLPGGEPLSLVTCELHSAAYNVSFRFENGKQDVVVNSVAMNEQVASNAEVEYENPDWKNIVYSAVFDAFNSIVLGTALNDTTVASGTGNIMYYGGGLVQTSALRDFIEGTRPLDTEAIRQTLEQTFQNMTISTLSSAALRRPEADAPPVDARTWRSVNVFSYQPADLYIAYGTGLLASALCVAWGLLVTLRRQNSASYSKSFSTIVRTTRSGALDALVPARDRKGEDPAPKALRRVRLVFDDREGAQSHGSIYPLLCAIDADEFYKILFDHFAPV
ncbi:hypothetical protein F4778DRAFT_773891 [Xylariomycetidae sp. FL2044]|nr:hypothetical protein F4778DRAFT_773891 [Xylariomycetidae sp. FL2044]